MKKKIKRLCIHAGHGNPGGLGCGAIGFMDESAESRKVVNELMILFNDNVPNFEVFDVTYRGNAAASNILSKLNSDVNKLHPDLSISIHLNSSTSVNANGTECYAYPGNAGTEKIGTDIVNRICEELRTMNRGCKKNKNLSVLRRVSCDAILLECAFVSGLEDFAKWNPNRCAKAIFDALRPYIEDSDISAYPESDSSTLYAVQVGAYKNKNNAEKIKARLLADGYNPIIVRR